MNHSKVAPVNQHDADACDASECPIPTREYWAPEHVPLSGELEERFWNQVNKHDGSVPRHKVDASDAELMPGSNHPGKKFENRRVLLTYKTHLDKDDFVIWLEDKIGFKTTFIRLAHESGDTAVGYPHTHVVIDFGKSFRTKDMLYFNYLNIHPHIRVLKSAKALHDAKLYIAKEDPENKDLIEIKTPMAERIWEKENLQDALREIRFPSEAPGMIALFKAKAAEAPTIPEWRLPKQNWQLEFMEKFKYPSNEENCRKVFWLFDTIGGCGKSAVADYLAITKPKDWFTTGAFGAARDASTILMSAIDKGWSGHGIIIDLPRQAQNHEGFYTVLEDLKNGRITATKYAGSVSYLKRIPHVIVFANWKPAFWKLSKDRWVLIEIKNARMIELPVTDQMYSDSASDMEAY